LSDHADDHRVDDTPSTAIPGPTAALSDDDADAGFPNAKSDEPPPLVTTAVCADEAGTDGPDAFEAVTCERNVDPTSAATTVYDDPVAPAIFTHPAPAESQRRH
jgi:hypothetical protein